MAREAEINTLLDDYFLPTDNVDPEGLLSDWRWLLGNKSIAIQAIAAVGNLFLKSESGRIYLLEIEDGTCECIAESVEQFKAKLDDRRNRRAWLQGFLVRDLRNSGILLEPGQCYGQKVPSLFGEDGDDPGSEPIDLAVHLSVLGQLHRQARGLPPGSVIDEVRVESPLDP